MTRFTRVTGGWTSSQGRLVPPLCGALASMLLPPMHIMALWYFWSQYSRTVDKTNCSCSCWDTVFKGTYESGIASYKHFYFNATENSMKIWIMTAAAVIGLYETIRHLMSLLMVHKLRISMATLFITSIFAHYYSWWGYVNYYNDEFYSQWNHQMFFTITEIISSVFVLYLANSDHNVSGRKCLMIVGISLTHILASGGDQFVFNVMRGQGYSHQVVRDLCFMVPDVMHTILPIWLLRRTRLNSQLVRANWIDNQLRKDTSIMLLFVTIGVLFCSWL